MLKVDKSFVVQTVLTCLLTIIGFFAVRALNSVEGSLEKVSSSVDNLNRTMATVVVDISYQRRDIDRNTEDIKDINKRLGPK